MLSIAFCSLPLLCFEKKHQDIYHQVDCQLVSSVVQSYGASSRNALLQGINTRRSSAEKMSARSCRGFHARTVQSSMKLLQAGVCLQLANCLSAGMRFKVILRMEEIESV